MSMAGSLSSERTLPIILRTPLNFLYLRKYLQKSGAGLRLIIFHLFQPSKEQSPLPIQRHRPAARLLYRMHLFGS